MFSLKTALQSFARRQSTAALTGRFARQEGVAVSVLCLTRDSDSYLDLYLGALENQALPRASYEVLVLDNASHDDTREVLRRFEARERSSLRFESLDQPQSESWCWNRLCERARGGALMFLSDAFIAHPALLVQHLMAHLEGETLLCGAPVPLVHSHLFPLQVLPVEDSRPAPVVCSAETDWLETLAPLVCSVEPLPEKAEADWLDFDLNHASLRRATLDRVGAFRGASTENFGNWGLLSRDFALRARAAGVSTRFLAAPSAWRSLKPSFLVDNDDAERHFQRFFAHHGELEREALETSLRTRFLPSALPVWAA